MDGGTGRNAAPIRELVGGEVYEYYPLGRHVVSARGVCGGRPTFKYTRVEVAGILRMLGAGEPIDSIVANYHRPELSKEAIEEAVSLAADALVSDAPCVQAKAA